MNFIKDHMVTKTEFNESVEKLDNRLTAVESKILWAVRDEDGNILIYSARNVEPIHALWRPASEKRQGRKSRWVGAPIVQRALWGFGLGVRCGKV